MPKSIIPFKLPELGFIAGTRVALGAGLGLILADKLNRRQRKRTGWTLLAIGALTTIPVAIHVIRKIKRPVAFAA